MVNIPKIVLKSQTRLTLNERFTLFAEQQEARLKMLKNDLRTRLVEESIQTGSHESAELSEKLDRLTRDIDNPEKHAELFLKKKHAPREHPKRRHRERDEVHEDPIVPAHRPLLYESGIRNGRIRKQSRNHPRLVTYGDVLSSEIGESEVSHWRAEALRGGRTTDDRPQRQKYSNPLMRDSDDEDEFGGTAREVSVHSRLGTKQSVRPKTNVPKNRPGPANYRRQGNKGGKYAGTPSAVRNVVTKEDLDRELDEYRQKGIVMDVEMGED